MQICWNVSSFKKSYTELFELEQYKLSGKITRQQSGSASILRDTYIYLVVWRQLWTCGPKVPHCISSSQSCRGGVRSKRSLGPTMTARGHSIGISIATLPQCFWGDMEAITVQKTSKYYTM